MYIYISGNLLTLLSKATDKHSSTHSHTDGWVNHTEHLNTLGEAGDRTSDLPGRLQARSLQKEGYKPEGDKSATWLVTFRLQANPLPAELLATFHNVRKGDKTLKRSKRRPSISNNYERPKSMINFLSAPLTLKLLLHRSSTKPHLILLKQHRAEPWPVAMMIVIDIHQRGQHRQTSVHSAADSAIHNA